MRANKNLKNKNKNQGRARRFDIIADAKPYPMRMAGFGSFAPSPMATSHRCYMVLAFDYVLTTANPGFSNTQIKLNSLFQPVGGAGEYGYGDELAAIYGKQRVLSSTIVIEGSLGGNLPHDIVLYPTTNAADAATSCQAARERRHAKSDVMMAGGNKVNVTIRSSETMANLVGGSWRDDEYNADGAADPSHVCYWNIAVAPRTATAAGAYVNGRVIAEVLFTELRPSTSS